MPDAPRNRVRRNLEEQETAAGSGGPAPAAPAETSQGKFFNGTAPTAAEAAKKKQGLIDMMRKRGDIASADKDDDDTGEA